MPRLEGLRGADRRPGHAGSPGRAGAVRVCRPRVSLGIGLGGIPEPGHAGGEPLPAGLVESARLDPPLFSPGHQGGIRPRYQRHLRQRWPRSWARPWPPGCGTPALPSTRPAGTTPPSRGIIIADTKFEFGTDAEGTLRADRRAAHPRLLPLLAGRPIRAGPAPAQLRQAAAAGLSRLAQGRGPLERRSPAAAASGRGGRGHQPPLSRGLPAADRTRSGA